MASLPRRHRRARRGGGIEGPARGTRGLLTVRHVVYGALESAVGERAAGSVPPRPAFDCPRTALFGGGAAGDGWHSHAGCQSGRGHRTPYLVCSLACISHPIEHYLV